MRRYQNRGRNNWHPAPQRAAASACQSESSADCGPLPFAVNLAQAVKQNNAFRTVLWTGTKLQLTVMCIPVGGEIGLERHPDLDQFLRVEEGQGMVRIGTCENVLEFERPICPEYACVIPAGNWHNLVNTGDCPLKLYSIYAPPQHPRGAIHRTKEEADRAEPGCSR